MSRAIEPPVLLPELDRAPDARIKIQSHVELNDLPGRLIETPATLAVAVDLSDKVYHGRIFVEHVECDQADQNAEGPVQGVLLFGQPTGKTHPDPAAD